MDGDKRPNKLRTILLAIPRRRNKKYKPPVYIPGKIDTGVRPSAVRGPWVDNWRINTLAEPRTRTDKYVFVEQAGTSTGISPSALTVECTSRTNDLSKPTLRYLTQNKKQYSFLGPKYMKKLDKSIQQSWNTIYNYYKKAWLEILKKRRAANKGMARDKKGKIIGKPKSEKENREEKLKHVFERCIVLAIPKPVFLPPKREKGKIADLAAMAARLAQIAEPKRIVNKYVRPSIDPTYVDPMRVSEGARSYVPSERIIEIAKCPAHRLVKEPVYKPGAVKRGALTCIVSPRFAELAVPKKKAAEKDNDLKENPFEISKNAMKYVASARIQKLAKPVERD